MIRDNIEQLFKDDMDSFLEYYENDSFQNTSSFTSSLESDSKELFGTFKDESDVSTNSQFFIFNPK
jgi:hypothetical protein